MECKAWGCQVTSWTGRLWSQHRLATVCSELCPVTTVFVIRTLWKVRHKTSQEVCVAIEGCTQVYIHIKGRAENKQTNKQQIPWIGDKMATQKEVTMWKKLRSAFWTWKLHETRALVEKCLKTSKCYKILIKIIPRIFRIFSFQPFWKFPTSYTKLASHDTGFKFQGYTAVHTLCRRRLSCTRNALLRLKKIIIK